MSDSYVTIIVLTFIGFMALAAILLIPVYLFLKREEVISESWTEEALSEQAEAADQAQDAPADPLHSADPWRSADPVRPSEPVHAAEAADDAHSETDKPAGQAGRERA